MTRGDGGTKEGKYIRDLPPEERKRLLEDMTLVQEPCTVRKPAVHTAQVEHGGEGFCGAGLFPAVLRLQRLRSRLAAEADKGEAFAMQFAK